MLKVSEAVLSRPITSSQLFHLNFSLLVKFASMIKSMTGLGQGRFDGDTFACTVEVRSTNHRFLDFHIKVPPEMSSLELKIRRLVQPTIRRGRVDLTLSIEKNDAACFKLNLPLLHAYLKALKQLEDEFAVSGKVDSIQLLRAPGIMNMESLKLPGEALRTVEDGIVHAVQNALEDLDRMRIEEGNALAKDILKRLDIVDRDVERIRSQASDVSLFYRARLRSRLNEILAEIEVDPNRLLQEAAFYAERSDVTEELTRLQSHSQQCRSLLRSSGEVGKTFDFLLQEMNREINTILSKTAGLAGRGLEISNVAILIRTEVEKIREQVQNIE
jgi:uncharacterized protein (TIGR00255 family)